MEGKNQLNKDIDALIKLCEKDMKQFGCFANLHEECASIIENLNSKIQELHDKWVDVQKHVNEKGMDEDGEYSYPELSIKTSLAYKRMSEIVNDLRFWLERMDLLDKFYSFEEGYVE